MLGRLSSCCPKWPFGMVVLALVVAGLSLPSAAAVAAPPVPAPDASGQSQTPLDELDEASAMALAYRTRQPVEVTAVTSGISRVWALPDGTFRAEQHLAPVRARDASGDWVDVDLTLEVKPDGSVGPKAHAHHLRLSGARGVESDSLVELGTGVDASELGWRGVLPAPVLDGQKATYAEVKPGVDLVVEVGRSGYEYYFLVKNAVAAGSMSSIAMPWRTGDGAVPESASGAGLRLRTASQSSVVVSQARMWDARVAPELSDHVYAADVDVSMVPNGSDTDLVLTPDESFFDDPLVEYPVTIDPSVHLNPAFDAFVQNTYSSDESKAKELRLGYSNDALRGCASPCRARSFLSFHNLGGYWGATVVSASLHLWPTHSWSCTKAGWEAWRTDFVNHTVRWNSWPAWRELDGTSDETRGYSSTCASRYVEISVKKTFQHSFNTQSHTANVGLRATNENHHNGWKKFNSSEASSNTPYVELVYNRTPNVPTGLAIDSCYTSCASPAAVRSGTPQIRATVSDPDGGVLRAEYEVFNSAGTTRLAASGSTVTGVSSGSARWWRIVPSAGGALPTGTYQWRARACDSWTCGAYSGWFVFEVVPDDLTLPTVSATPYAETSAGTWNGGPGQAGTFTFGPNSGSNVTEYVYQLNGGNAVTVAAGTPQAEQLSANQQQVSTGVTGFDPVNVALARNTSLGHGSTDSLSLTPLASGGNPGGAVGDTYATVGGDYGGMRVGMQAGKRYLISGWVYVPAATGLNPSGATGASRGLRLVAFYGVGTTFTEIASPKASITNGWQRLSVAMTVPSSATDAFIRLYNGFNIGSGKTVYWDDLSVREVVGTTTVESVTPTRDGLNVLSVQSRNSVGVSSDPKIYRFLVAPSSGAWHWHLDDNTGSVAASVPDTRPATLSASRR
ncbi:DNRLRE domain-containing protein [Polymorphospora sp. A560]